MSLSLGERIRGRRKELGWSLRQLAQKVNLSFSFLSDVERGKRSISADNLLALSQVLGVPMDHLMGAPGAQGVQDPQVAGSAVQLPPGLTYFASSVNLPFCAVLCLYWCARTIEEYRGRERAGLEHFDWVKFHRALKEWL